MYTLRPMGDFPVWRVVAPAGGFQSHLATCNITLHRNVTYYSTVTAPAGDYSTDRTHSRDRFLFPSPCQRIARNPARLWLYLVKVPSPPESDVCGMEVCQIIGVESSDVNPDFFGDNIRYLYRFRYLDMKSGSI